MKVVLLLLAASIGLASCSKDAPPAADLATNQAVGTYSCKAYFTLLNNGVIAKGPFRDTTLRISKVTAGNILVDNQPLAFQQEPLEWLGHQPSRNNNCFTANYHYVLTQKILQLDERADSMYYEDAQTSRIYGKTWYFYGKKR